MITNFSVPAEIKPWIEKNTRHFVALLPNWVAHLYVDFRDHHETAGLQAECRTDYRYRRVYLTIYPAMMNASESERRHTFIHEAAHVFLAPIQEFIEHSVKAAFKDNKPLADVIHANWDIANEATVEDIARGFMEQAKDLDALNEVDPKAEPHPQETSTQTVESGKESPTPSQA